MFDGAALVEHMVSRTRLRVCLGMQPRTVAMSEALWLSLQVQSYRFLDGMESLLQRLKVSGYELHAMSNYPIW